MNGRFLEEVLVVEVSEVEEMLEDENKKSLEDSPLALEAECSNKIAAVRPRMYLQLQMLADPKLLETLSRLGDEDG